MTIKGVRETPVNVLSRLHETCYAITLAVNKNRLQLSNTQDTVLAVRNRNSRLTFPDCYFPRQIIIELWHYAEAVKQTSRGGANFPSGNRDSVPVLKRRIQAACKAIEMESVLPMLRPLTRPIYNE